MPLMISRCTKKVKTVSATAYLERHGHLAGSAAGFPGALLDREGEGG
jgi:hypothetical protein